MSRGNRIQLKTPAEIEKMRVTCRVTAQGHKLVREIARPGISTLEIDRQVEKLVRDAGLIPAFQSVVAPGAPGPFGHTVCTSVNDEVVHGLPTERILKEGDILKADMGAIHDGWYSDAAITIPIGKVSPEAQKLIDVTRESLMRAIRLIKPGVRLRKLCGEIQRYVEVENNMFVVKAYVGHGLGRSLWEPPQVPNYVPKGWQAKELDITLQPGLILAIEPMVNLGTELVRTDSDGWTVRTQDGSLSAHFEHDVLVTETGYEVLTLLEGDPEKYPKN
ncbi:MAG: type I methionyl aminopeptidase [Planctomycetes bacterium]|nr:type I methionyl aminopeptidase [Planctomycetota bacterium]NUQ34677.1 type I methionyl aminopeptidase [Planctomycetaceae bacterium]